MSGELLFPSGIGWLDVGIYNVEPGEILEL
jgi:hypothetical protein